MKTSGFKIGDLILLHAIVLEIAGKSIHVQVVDSSPVLATAATTSGAPHEPIIIIVD